MSKDDAVFLRQLVSSLPFTDECRLRIYQIADKIESGDAHVVHEPVDLWSVRLMYKTLGSMRPTFVDMEDQIGSKEEATARAKLVAENHLSDLIKMGKIEEWEVRLRPLFPDC